MLARWIPVSHKLDQKFSLCLTKLDGQARQEVIFMSY